MLLPTSTLTLSVRCWSGWTPPRGKGTPNGTKSIVRHLYILSIYTLFYHTIHNTMSIRFTSTFRLARSAVAPRAALPVISRVRTLSTSPVWRASEAAPQDPMADPKFQSFFDKIKNHQGAVDAMLKVGEVMKNKGMSLL
jgi:hypothetical protein